MMKFTILISFQLFCILLFSKTFVRADPNEVKVLIKWRRLPGMKDLKKFLINWTERFELKLFRLSYEDEPYFGRKSEHPIASGKIGRYDFTTLIVPLQQIGTQNVEGKGKEVAESSSRKGKGKRVATDMSKDKDLFELEIKIISPENLNIQQTITKRLQRLPNENEIIVCSFHTNSGCSNENNQMEMERPNRKIFFELQERQNLRIRGILCTKSKEVLVLKRGMEYKGKICQSDEYTINFIGTRKNKSNYYYQLSFICDEAFYESPIINTYQLWVSADGGKCKLKLIEDNFLIEYIEEEKNKQEGSQSQLPIFNSANMLNLSMENKQNILQQLEAQQLAQFGHPSRPIHQPISSELLRNALHAAAQDSQQITGAQFLQRQLSQPNLHHSQPGIQSRYVLMKSATMPRDYSALSNRQPNLQGQSSNPIYGSSVGAGAGEIGQNILPTNPQPLQIASTLQQLRRQYLRQHSDLSHSSSRRHDSGHAGTSRQPKKQYLPQHSDLVQTNLSHHSSSQIPGSGQQIQPSGMSLPKEHNIPEKVHLKTVLDSLQIPQLTSEKQIGHFQSQKQIRYLWRLAPTRERTDGREGIDGRELG